MHLAQECYPLWAPCGSLWALCGSVWAPCGSLWAPRRSVVDPCGPLRVLVGACGSLCAQYGPHVCPLWRPCGSLWALGLFVPLVDPSGALVDPCGALVDPCWLCGPLVDPCVPLADPVWASNALFNVVGYNKAILMSFSVISARIASLHTKAGISRISGISVKYPGISGYLVDFTESYTFWAKGLKNNKK